MTWPWIVAFGALTTLVLAEFAVILGVLGRVTVQVENIAAALAKAERGHESLHGTVLPPLQLVEPTSGTQPGPAHGPMILLAITRACPARERLMEKLAAQDHPPGGINHVVLLIGEPASADLGPVPHWLARARTEGQDLVHALRIDRTPLAFAVDARQRIVEVAAPEGIEALNRLAALCRTSSALAADTSPTVSHK